MHLWQTVRVLYLRCQLPKHQKAWAQDVDHLRSAKVLKNEITAMRLKISDEFIHQSLRLAVTRTELDCDQMPDAWPQCSLMRSTVH